MELFSILLYIVEFPTFTFIINVRLLAMYFTGLNSRMYGFCLHTLGSSLSGSSAQVKGNGASSPYDLLHEVITSEDQNRVILLFFSFSLQYNSNNNEQH